MAETSRKKTLPLAVLAAPALAFGSLTLAAAPALAVPVDQVHTTSVDLPENVSPEISVSADRVQVGETIRITIDNFDDVTAAYDSEGYEIIVQGDVADDDGFFARFGEAGIEQADDAYTYEFTIPESIDTASGDHTVGADTSFVFQATFIVNPEDEAERTERISNLVTVYIVADETPADDETPDEGETPADDETPGEGETPADDETPDEGETPADDETPGEGETPADDETPRDDETSEEPEPVEPALTLEQDEILLEDFVGDAEEDTGVLHRVVGAAPGSTVEYAVETPATISPFDSSDDADEEGVLEFWIHGYDVADLSVYLGEYTTTATFEDVDGETQELSATFTVVEDYEGDEGGTENEDDEIVSVVDTENDQANLGDDEDEAPTVGSAAQLADTGASGAQLAWIAAGLLALGGAFVVFANRARLFGRKH